MPKFSVVVPTYQRNDFVTACLNKLAPGVQTLSPDQYEVIVTDDGKTSTAQTLVETEFPWARWVKGPQQGPGPNRNNGARQSKGEWVIFVDDDCLPEPNFIEAYARAADENYTKKTDLSQRVWVYEGKTVSKQGIHSPMEEAPLNETGGNLWSCNMMVRRDDFFAFGPFDEFFYCKEDVDFRERLRAANVPFQFVPDALIDHPPRRRSGGHAGLRLMEYETLMLICGGFDKSIRGWLMRMTAHDQLRTLTRYPLSRDTILALRQDLFLLRYIFKNTPKWEKQFAEYRAKPKRYKYPNWL